MAEGFTVRAPGGHLRNVVMVTAAIGAVVLGSLLWFRGQTMVVSFNIPFAFVLCVSISIAAFGLVVVTGRIVRDWHPVAQWAMFVSSFAVAAAIGTLLTPVVFSVVGTIPGGLILTVFQENIRGTMPTTIAFGTFMLLVEGWKARLRESELALRTQQMERERAERLAAEAQLASLSSRVQPHFLFNTLNAIAALVRDNPAAAEQMVEQLSAVLRSSLNTAVTVPLERELKLIDDYLRIQQARLGERLRFEIARDADVPDNVPVPPFAVQTMVENAVKHVAGRQPDGVLIRVHAYRSGDAVLIDVTDDGPGFEPASVTAGHGLDNLHGRLRALYGDRATIVFDRRDRAMTVRLRVPIANNAP
jgi:signal transduction histidine kinase